MILKIHLEECLLINYYATKHLQLLSVQSIIVKVISINNRVTSREAKQVDVDKKAKRPLKFLYKTNK